MIRPVDDRLAHSDQQEQREVQNDHHAEGVVVTLETLTGGKWQWDANAIIIVVVVVMVLSGRIQATV